MLRGLAAATHLVIVTRGDAVAHALRLPWA
jgi:hypothetical protein